jgi:hypothetical protein
VDSGGSALAAAWRIVLLRLRVLLLEQLLL